MIDSCPVCAGMCCDPHQDRVDAVLAIHAPCHTAETGPYGCQFGHWDVDTGVPDEPAVCIACGGEWHVVYPCPTAAALLGIPARRAPQIPPPWPSPPIETIIDFRCPMPACVSHGHTFRVPLKSPVPGVLEWPTMQCSACHSVLEELP
jgi:hypothetical protein